MIQAYSRHWVTIAIIGLLTAFHIWGIKTVPFHPDEATQIYMSADFELLFSRPASLGWQPVDNTDPRQTYRLLDAPLARYLIGLGRSIARQQPLPADWDWSKSWEENRLAGALPPDTLLTAARLAITLLLPLSMLLVYGTAGSLGGRLAGVLAVILFGLNALVLLHGRRAMAEGLLLFGVSFALWSLVSTKSRPWLVGLAMAIAFNAKQSTLFLVPVGLLAVAWPPASMRGKVGQIAGNILQFVGAFVLVTLALNPVIWNRPIEATRAALAARQDLLNRQVSDAYRLVPEKVLDTPYKGSMALVANLYITPPMFAEVGNYLEYTSASEATYLAIAGHNLLRTLSGGAFMLTLTLTGLAWAGYRSTKSGYAQQRQSILLILATLAQAVGLIVTLPLPWQRYATPLVPMIAIWTAYGLTILVHLVKEALQARAPGKLRP